MKPVSESVILLLLLLFPSEQVQGEREEVDVVQFVRSAAADGRDAARCQDVGAAQ